MGITKVEFTYKKPHLVRDPKTKLWIGYRVDIRAVGKRHRDTFRTRGEAERFLSELRTKRVYAKAGLGFDRSDVPRVSELLDARLAEITNHAAKVRATRVFKVFRSLLDSDLPVTDVKRSHFKVFNNKRASDGVKAETVNREVNELSAAFHRATDLFPKRLEDYEPTIARPKVKRGKRQKHEITRDEAMALISAIRTQKKKREYPTRKASRFAIAWMFELAWLTGLRIGEAISLKKTDFNERDKTLRVMRSKTKRVTTLKYLPERVVEILNEASGSSRSEKIFDIVCSRNTVTAAIREACNETGLVYGRDQIDGITFHSNRHSFTSRLVRVTDPATAASFTDHSSLEMLDYYAHASEESKRRAMELMYGGRDKELLEIYQKVRSGKMDEISFLAALK